MERTDKAEFIESMRSAFSQAPLVILTEFQGSTPPQLDKLRRAVESTGARFQVVKNTLCRIAVADTPVAGLAASFKGNIGVVLSGEDPIATAKIFRQALKENDKLKTRAGFFDGDVLDAKKVDAVADLPSREQLLATLLATLQEGPRQVLGVLQGPARDLVYVLNNYATKLEEQG